ncbi:MCE family protein [bacterium]|nr:MCE family protein [bacterium]
MNERKELTAGIFAAAGIVIFAVFVFSIGQFTGPTREVLVEFGYVDGLGPDAPVQYAGYRVGKVESVQILPGTPVRLRATLTVPKDLPVSRGAEVLIASMGMMGEKVVEILPAAGEPLPDGDVLRGSDPILLSQIFDQVGSLLDDKTSGNIRQVAANVLKLTEDMNEVTSTLRRLSAEHGDDLERILSNAAKSSDHLPGLLKKIEAAAGDIEALAENLKGMTAENRPEIHEMVKNLNTTSDNLKALSSDVRRHPWKLIRKSKGEK